MEDEIIDVRELALALCKHIKFIMRVTGVCLVLAVIYLLLASSVYQSRALLRIKPPRALNVSSLNTAPAMNVQNIKQMMSSYAEIIKSIELEDQKINKSDESGQKRENTKDNPYSEVNITTEFFRDTDIMQITVFADRPDTAKRANDLLIKKFLARLTELSREEYKASRVFMENRTKIAEKNLKDAENKLNNFKKKNALIDPNKESEIIKEKTSRIENMTERNKVDLSTAEARLTAVNKQLASATASVATNTKIDLYNKYIAELESERINYLELYTDQHPYVIQVTQKIAQLKKKLEEEITNITTLKTASNNRVYLDILATKFESEAEVQVAKKNLNRLAQLTKENNNKIKKLAELSQQYNELNRKCTLTRDIYSMLAKRLEEARIAEANAAHEVQVLTKGTLEERPVKPRKMFILIIAFCIGAFGSSCFIIIREIINKTINDEKDVEYYLDLPVLGSIPDKNSLNRECDRKGFLSKIKNIF